MITQHKKFNKTWLCKIGWDRNLLKLFFQNVSKICLWAKFAFLNVFKNDQIYTKHLRKEVFRFTSFPFLTVKLNLNKTTYSLKSTPYLSLISRIH